VFFPGFLSCALTSGGVSPPSVRCGCFRSNSHPPLALPSPGNPLCFLSPPRPAYDQRSTFLCEPRVSSIPTDFSVSPPLSFRRSWFIQEILASPCPPHPGFLDMLPRSDFVLFYILPRPPVPRRAFVAAAALPLFMNIKSISQRFGSDCGEPSNETTLCHF